MLRLAACNALCACDGTSGDGTSGVSVKSQPYGESVEIVSAAAGESAEITELIECLKPVYPKDAPARQLIGEALQVDKKIQALFHHLGERAREDIISAFKECTAKEGELLVLQGTDELCLYIVDIGQVELYIGDAPDGKVDADNLGASFCSLGPRNIIGELALLDTVAGASATGGSWYSAKALSDCKLWQLDRKVFKQLLSAAAVTYVGWLSEVDIFKKLKNSELHALRDVLQCELYMNGEAVTREGEVGTQFFILENGSCSAFIQGSGGEKEVKQYKVGEYFGEIALLTMEPRKATVRATGTGASVLSISKEAFTKLLGPLHGILKEHINEYPQYAEFLKEA